MEDIGILLIVVVLIYVIFFRGCSFDDSENNETENIETINYSDYIYETAFNFKYEHSTNSENRYCRIYVDGIEVGKIDDGEAKSTLLMLEGGYHDIYIESITIIRKSAHSSKQYFEITDEKNCFDFTIKDGSILGLSISCDESYHSDTLAKVEKK